MIDPVVVYLDSQDFSRLSPSHRDHAAHISTKRELVELKASGAARFVFTDVHVFENLPVSKTNSAPGLERIRTIADLCGDDHLPSSATIAEHELRLLAGAETPLWPEWYPYFEMEEPDRRQIGSDVIAKMATNRNQRRRMAKALKGPLDVGLGIALAEEFLARYPFLQGGEKILTAYLAQRVGWEAVQNLLRTSLRNIAGFSEWLVANWAHGQSFVSTLRDQNLSVHKTLVDLYSKMQSLFQNADLSPDESGRIIKAIYDEKRNQFLHDFAAKISLKVLGKEAQSPLCPEKTPSLFAAMSFLMDVAFLSALPKNPRNPNKQAGSDFTDAAHVFFLPRVDIFRADHFSCSVIRKSALNGDTAVCPNLNDLPELIREIAKSRRSAILS